jgi:hypothetical protein
VAQCVKGLLPWQSNMKVDGGPGLVTLRLN